MIENVPLASASPVGVIDGPNAGVRVRVRARVAITEGAGKPAAWFTARVAQMRADAAAWWLVASAPQPLERWLAAQTPTEAQLPAGSPLVRGLWMFDNWTTGALTFAASVFLFLAAGALRWLSGHPARRWAAIGLAGAIGAWLAAIH